MKIKFPNDIRIYIACGKTDMRKSIDGLSAIVSQNFNLNPFENALFLFCGGKRDRIKALLWEGDGFLLLYKRLEGGVFQWPRTTEEVREITPQQYIGVEETHTGYFSIDRKGKAIDSRIKRGQDSSDDISAYDLILKNKERLLSFKEPVRFIFSHSALREGWDNPNVFQICTLKHSDS